MKGIYEVRWHGRGGQGVVLANKILAVAALREGLHVRAFPEFGPERTGAPVRGFTRVSDEPIDLHQQIYNPDAVAVIDPGLAKNPAVAEGLKEGGILVANWGGEPGELRRVLGLRGRKVFAVDAVRIAQEVFKRPRYNTAVIGALVKATGMLRLESVEGSMGEVFAGDMLTLNTTALKRGYEEGRGEG